MSKQKKKGANELYRDQTLQYQIILYTSYLPLATIYHRKQPLDQGHFGHQTLFSHLVGLDWDTYTNVQEGYATPRPVKGVQLTNTKYTKHWNHDVDHLKGFL